MADRDLTAGVPSAELKDGGMVAGTIGDEQALLVRDGGVVYAVGGTCTHYGAPLGDGAIIDGAIRCPWHHACFDIRTGVVLRAPALSPLARWTVEQRGDRFFPGDAIPSSPPRPVPGPASVVIVGAGAAGVNVADTLRNEGFAGRVVLISRENDLPYDKPNLSKDYLAGNAPADWLPLHPREYYEDRRIELRLGVAVSSIDTTKKAISTSSGESLSFDALVLATGSAVRALRIPGAERVHYLRTRAEAEALVAKSGSARRVAIIGGSFIGLEVAASLRQRKVEVAVTSPDRIPLERVFGPELGSRIQRVHEEHGVVFHLGRKAVRVDAEGVVLDDGGHIQADLIVAGIGVSPAVELARAAGISSEDGILVNEFLETSAPNVYACGDVASWPSASSDGRLRVEHWVVAGRQGQTVARNILGRRERFSAVPYFWSAHYDFIVSYIGHGAGWQTLEIDGSLDDNDAAITYRKAGKVVAVATINRDAVGLAAEHEMELALNS